MLCFSLVTEQNQLCIMMKPDEEINWHHCTQCNVFLKTEIQLLNHKKDQHPVTENSKIKKMKFEDNETQNDKDLEPIERYETDCSAMTEEDSQLNAENLDYTSFDFDEEMR